MPQPKKLTTEDIRRLQVDAALDEAVKIGEEYATMIARRKANRTELRSLIDLGHVSDDDKKLIAELYPPRAHENGDAETADTTTPAAA